MNRLICAVVINCCCRRCRCCRRRRRRSRCSCRCQGMFARGNDHNEAHECNNNNKFTHTQIQSCTHTPSAALTVSQPANQSLSRSTFDENAKKRITTRFLLTVKLSRGTMVRFNFGRYERHGCFEKFLHFHGLAVRNCAAHQNRWVWPLRSFSLQLRVVDQKVASELHSFSGESSALIRAIQLNSKKLNRME